MKLESEEIEAIARAVASHIVDHFDLSSGRRLPPSVGQASELAERDQTAGSANRQGQTRREIIETLGRGERKHAVELWQKCRESENLAATKQALYEAAAQDKAEYYRWEKNGLPDDSHADRDIREALLKTLP